MTSTFNALVRFDLQARDVAVSVGGRVGTEAVEELCEVIERSVDITGRHAFVDLSGAQVDDGTLLLISNRCRGIADISASVG